ncbi:hypothetical protein P3342_009131 [Pyrenophora teres f. teres]|nr:hypothetical protein P3342_009131 [Pyrenophora teres f. teres]
MDNLTLPWDESRELAICFPGFRDLNPQPTRQDLCTAGSISITLRVTGKDA